MERYAKMKADGLSWTQLTKVYNVDNGTNLTKDQVRDRVRKAYDKLVKPDKPRGAIVGVFSDTHFPYHEKNYMEFVYDTFDEYKVDKIICTGDLLDHHALSRFDSHPDNDGAKIEAELADIELTKLKAMFPKMVITLGNHDRIPARQASKIQLGDRWIRPFREAYDLPKAWETCERYIFDDVLYSHGLDASGKDGAVNKAIRERRSSVSGHSHNYGGIKINENEDSIIFGMNVGCGIDTTSWAMGYAKGYAGRPSLGCGIVKSSEHGIYVPMPMRYRSKK